MQPQNLELEAFIRRVPVFSNLPQPMFEVVRKACQMRQYGENDYLFQQGEPSKGMFIVLSGEAALMQVGADGLKRQVGMVRPGQFVDQQALFAEMPETASLKAVLPLTALFLSRRDMSALMAYYKELPSLMGLTAQSQSLHEVTFKTQRDNEQILLKTHRHPWAYARWAWLPMILVGSLWMLGALLPPLQCVLFLFSIVVGGLGGLYLYMEWANDAVIITDQRVVRINRNILRFSESINEVLIHSIQEARADIPGTDPFAVLFNYGTVDIRTGGQAGNFRLDYVPNPESVQKLIMYDHQLRRQAMQDAERSEMRSDLTRWINGQPVTVTPTANAKPRAAAGVRGILGSVETKADGSIIFRKHWIVWLRSTSPALLILALALLLLLATLLVPFLQRIGALTGALSFVMACIGGAWMWYADWDWRHDYMHLQDSTILFLHQRPLWLQNERDQVLLKQVDNVVAETVGLTARFLGYGTIRLSLVGADQHKVFPYTPNPQAVQSEITRRQAALKQQEDIAREEQEKERLGEYFQMYHEMMTQQGQTPATPSARPPTMKTGEVPTVTPSIPMAPAPTAAWQTPASPAPVLPTAPRPETGTMRPGAPDAARTPAGWTPPTPMPRASRGDTGPLRPTAPDAARTPAGWTPSTPMPSIPPAPSAPGTPPPLVATGGQPDRNRPPRIPVDRPFLSPGRPYVAPRVPPAMPPAPPEMPPSPPAPPRPNRVPRRLT